MFKKTGLALAMAALAANSFASELTAGKDTKFEVNVDVGAYYLSKKEAAGTAQNELLGKGMNQVEIKATHTINDDVSVFGEFEFDYDPVVDNGALSTDDTRLGVASKRFGRIAIGQFDSFFEDNVMESLGVGHGENGFMTEPNASSSNDGRHLQYSHKIGNLAFGVDLTSNNNVAKNDAGHGAAIAATYQLGDLTVGLGYSDNAKYKSDTSAANTLKNATGLTASYKFGSTKVTGLVATETAVLNDVKSNYAGVAVTHTMGELDFGLSFQNRHDGTKSYAEWAAGVGYTPFKNFTMYLDLNGLNMPKDAGDIVELGVKYTF